MTSQKLFRYPELWILPERGRFTALEALDEWIDNLPYLMSRWDERKGTAEAPMVDPAARSAFQESADDLAKLTPHLDGDEAAEHLRRFHELREQVRGYFVAEPAIDALEQLELQRQHVLLRESLQETVRIVRGIMVNVGDPPHSLHTGHQLREIWGVATKNLENARPIFEAAWPVLGDVPESRAVLDELGSVIDALGELMG